MISDFLTFGVLVVEVVKFGFASLCVLIGWFLRGLFTRPRVLGREDSDA